MDLDYPVDEREGEHDEEDLHAYPWHIDILSDPQLEIFGSLQSYPKSLPDSNQLKPLEFLVNFTTRTGINRTYNYKRLLSEVALADLSVPSADRISENEEPTSQMTATMFDNIDMDSWFTSDSNQSTTASSDGLQSMHTDTNPALNLQLGKVKDLIATALSSGGLELDAGMLVPDMVDVERIFSPEQTPLLLKHFWKRWDPHCPIVHKPTFVAHDAHPLLLMTMFLMGACTSLEVKYEKSAKRLLDSAEYIVFSHPVLLNGLADSGVSNRGDGIAVFQAAYFISIMQKWEGSEQAKDRIRRQKFPIFVTVGQNSS